MRCLIRCTRICVSHVLPNKSRGGLRVSSSRLISFERDQKTRNGGSSGPRRKWSMLEKQEHLYKTMLASGEVLLETEGSPEVTDALVEALRLQWAYGHPFTPRDLPLLTHAFHEYPAGMQPASARHLLQTVLPGNVVLDPFVGGGTVVLEAMRAGRYAIGSDISPLALFVCRGRCWCPSSRVLDAFREASRIIHQASAACAAPEGNPSTPPRAGRNGSSGKDWDTIKGAIADYLKVKGSRSGRGIEGTAEGIHEGGADLDRSLWFVFSVARSRAAKARHRLAGSRNPLVAADFFAKVCQEYAAAVEDLKRIVEQGGAPGHPRLPPLLVQRDARDWKPSFTSQILAAKDARRLWSHSADAVTMMPVSGPLESRHGGRRGYAPGGIERRPEDRRDATPVSGTPMEACEAVVDTVLTSPPYPGVYDYLSHAREVRARLGHVPRWGSAVPTIASSPEHHEVDRGQGSVEGDIWSSSAEAVPGAYGHARAVLLPVRATSVKEDADDAVSESVDFLDSPVPVGRDWARGWTAGEIGAKTMVRRRLTDISSGQSSVSSPDDPTQDSRGETRFRTGGASGVEMEWAKDEGEWLGAMAGLLKVGGRMAVMVGDGGGVDTRSSLLRGVEDLRSTAEGLGQLRVLGWATLRAAEGARRNMRTEHLVLLEK